MCVYGGSRGLGEEPFSGEGIDSLGKREDLKETLVVELALDKHTLNEWGKHNGQGMTADSLEPPH